MSLIRIVFLHSILVWGFVSFVKAQPEQPKSACQPCASLLELKLPDVRILEAAERSVDTVLLFGSNQSASVAHCRVLGVIGPEINFELLLPNSWNGRFAMGWHDNISSRNI